MTKNKPTTIKAVARKNTKEILNTWVSEVLETNPSKRDYESALDFVEDIIEKAQTEPEYLKLVIKLSWLAEESELAAKLLNQIFKTVTHSRSISGGKMNSVLEFDHKLIMAELKDAAEGLRQLREKAE